MRQSVAWSAAMAVVLLLVLAAPVGAFPLSTCTMSLSSTDASGSPLDTVTSGAPDATQDDPLQGAWDGKVDYTGSTGSVVKNFTYHVDVFGIPTPMRGGDPNTNGSTDGNGSVSFAAAPFRATGLYFVSGLYTGEGGSCAGSGWFKLLGDPVGTVPFFFGLVLVIGGLLLLIRGALGHGLTAVLGGLLTGAGAAILLVIFSALPLGSNTPVATLALGVVAGIAIALRGQRGRGREVAA